MPKLFVGPDVSQKLVADCFLLEDGTEPTKRFGFPHNPAGVETLVSRINATSDELGIDHLLVGMETTGMRWWHLSEALRTCEGIQRLSPAIYAINAKLVANFKKAPL